MTGLQLTQGRSGLVVEEIREDDTTLFELSGSKMQGRYALIRAGLEE
ncbi:MAG: hypothetical protein ACT6FD_01270 [Methanosarcinaceae archaeon]